MRKCYTRPCNFYYGNYARMLIEKKKALSLTGRSNIAFDQVEVFHRKKKQIAESKFYSIKLGNFVPRGKLRAVSFEQSKSIYLKRIRKFE